MANKAKKPHAILIPYPLQAHLNPAVHLAIKLATQGFTITFITTDSIHNQTTAAAGPGTRPDMFAPARESGLDIRYTTMSDGLPVEFDRSLNNDQFNLALLHVFSAHVEVAVGEIVRSGEDVNCLIADTFFVWPSKIANKFGLVHISFWTGPALVFTLYYHLDLLRFRGHFACQDRCEDTIDYIPGVKGLEEKDMTSYLQETDTTSICHQIIFNCFDDTKKADFVICNTVQELEPDVIVALQPKIPFYAIGPLFPNDFGRSTAATSMWSEFDCTQWLNQKPHGSVLYVSFGSHVHVTKNDLKEIAYGLALSKVSFAWAIRPDPVSSNDTHPLPVGYKEEVSDRSIIIDWCCQHSVLTHPAIGGFLTHCGWNSTLESIWCEVPLLCFPLYTDQFTNRKLIVDDWKVGTNLTDKKLITKEDVACNISRLMCGKLNEELRNKIKEVKNVLVNALSPSGSSQQNMTQFIKDLKEKIETKAQAKKSKSNGT